MIPTRTGDYCDYVGSPTNYQSHEYVDLGFDIPPRADAFVTFFFRLFNVSEKRRLKGVREPATW